MDEEHYPLGGGQDEDDEDGDAAGDTSGSAKGKTMRRPAASGPPKKKPAKRPRKDPFVWFSWSKFKFQVSLPPTYFILRRPNPGR